jgi:HupE/UreJ protein
LASSAQDELVHVIEDFLDASSKMEQPSSVAYKALAAETGNSLTAAPLYVGDTVVDVWLEARPGHPVYEYLLSSNLDPGLPDQDQTANLILDHSPGGTKLFRSRGLLTEPISISRSSLQASITFVKEGIKHILEGLDHVLFVLCLVIGAATLRSFAWRVTGFTLGHSVTLSLGFFGFVAQGAWFVPTIETGIALSIVYGAAIAVLAPPENSRQERSMVLITTLIGLLHGLGFSFVLQNILQVDSPDIWQSLLAFNVGVEVGQLMIVLAVWPLFWFLGRTNASAASLARSSIAVGCGLIAIYWTVERVAELSSLV